MYYAALLMLVVGAGLVLGWIIIFGKRQGPARAKCDGCGAEHRVADLMPVGPETLACPRCRRAGGVTPRAASTIARPAATRRLR
jgi:hypothetical protein